MATDATCVWLAAVSVASDPSSSTNSVAAAVTTTLTFALNGALGSLAEPSLDTCAPADSETLSFGVATAICPALAAAPTSTLPVGTGHFDLGAFPFQATRKLVAQSRRRQ